MCESYYTVHLVTFPEGSTTIWASMKKSKKLHEFVERRQWWLLAGIIAGFSAIVAGNMTRWSIWFDEAFSAYIVRFNLAEITHYTAVDVHPPLYYWLLKGWVSVWGTSEWAFRSLSLICAIGALIGIFVIVRRLIKSPHAALLAAAFAALSPMLIRFSHEARMYTLVLIIVIWATYLLVRAQEKRASRWWWAGYGVLLTLGMLTHYFTALAWLSHWVWRWWQKRCGNIRQFWTREWIGAHVLAVAGFAPWLPIVIEQFASVQAGFWIPSVSAYTPVDYMSNTLLYLEYGTVLGWWAVLLLAAGVAIGWLIYTARRDGKAKEWSSIAILWVMAIAPPVLLFVLSLPPLKSSFIDRYVMYAQILSAVLIAICAWYAWRKNRRTTLVAAGIVLLTFGAGIFNVYYYGNYNKNSSTSIRVKETVRQIAEQGTSGQPIVAATPWIYYEAVFYDSREHRTYFVENKNDYLIGSAKMLEKHDTGKIVDLQEFTQRHRYIWYLDNYEKGDVVSPDPSWQRLKSVGTYDHIDKNTRYRASLFDTQPHVSAE